MKNNEPPTSRGSEGEARPVAWRIMSGKMAHTSWIGGIPSESRKQAIEHAGFSIAYAYAAPQPAQPSVEAWRRAIAERAQAVWKVWIPHPEMDLIESRAREISKGA